MGPSFWQWDASISRNFRIGEGVKRIQARVEAYNVTNSYRPTNPATTITGSTYGQLTGAQTATPAIPGTGNRDMQFALKYVF